MQLHNKTFIDWFHNRVICEELKSESEIVKWLGFGPRDDVNKYEGYDANGFTFWTEGQDKKSSYLWNSGVSILSSSTFYASARIYCWLMLNRYTTGGYMKYRSSTTMLLLWVFSNASQWIIINDALKMTTLMDSLL